MSTETDDLDFSKFFDQAAKGEEPAAAMQAEPEPAAASAEPEPAAAKTDPEPEPAAAKPEPVDVSKLITDTVAATAAALKTDVAPEPAPAAPEATVDPEEEQKLAAFAKDWPDHFEFMNKQLERQRTALMSEFQKFLEPLQARLTPLQEFAEMNAAQAHEAEILTGHPDAFDLADDINAWVATRPEHLRPAYEHTLAEGSAKHVVALISEFKESTGRKAQAPTAQAPDPEKEARLKASEPVAATRSHTTDVVDPNDFAGAFQRAAAEAQKQAV
jgi:hypothetical protein